MSRLICKLLFFVPVLIFMFAMSYKIDLGSYYSDDDYSKQLADILLSGKMAIPKSKIELRLLQKHLVADIDHLDIVALGSSRTRQMRSSIFPGRSFLNNAVNQGSFEDYLAITELYYRYDKWPTKVILGLDPWVLNRNNSSTEWQDVVQEYNAMAERLGFELSLSKWVNIQRLKMRRYYMLLSPAYFQQSFKYAMLGITYFGAPPKAIESIDSVSDIVFFTDGSSESVKKYNRSTSEVHEAAISYANMIPIPFMEQFNKVDNVRVQQLGKFVDYYRARNIEVVFFLPPFHPATYEIWSNNGKNKIIQLVEEKYREIALERSIEVVGSFNPKLCGVDETDFYDGAHPKESGIIKIFQ